MSLAISLDWIRLKAHAIYTKHGTTMSRAFLAALGETPKPWAHHQKPKVGEIVSYETYNELKECFANSTSPMDWL